MILKKAYFKNVGPIDEITLNFVSDNEKDQKPFILVGSNGTGKSTVLSTIVDSFYELSSKSFSNAEYRSEDNNLQFFRVISPSEIHAGREYMISYLEYATPDMVSYYNKATGDIPIDKIKKETGILGFPEWEDGNKKAVSLTNKKKIEELWQSNVICYFGPNRYEKPLWMGNKYYSSEDYLHPSVQIKWTGDLDNPITVRDVTHVNLQWILDVIADSRADIYQDSSGLHVDKNTNISNTLLLKNARDNLEIILSTILGIDVYFALNYRNTNSNRFCIKRKDDDSVFCPTLDSLSTGQSALFNMFATIIRYADNNNINNSIKMEEIKGIVVIDEIELHLHPTAQKEVLPKLIKMFPKIQFIISSHSPLFLLGMRDVFGEDGFNICELPSASIISVEKFQEFNKAYEFFKETDAYKEELIKQINEQSSGKNIIITEGCSDWKHFEAARNALSTNQKYSHIFDGINYEFFHYTSKDENSGTLPVLQMGDAILQLCKELSKVPHGNKFIFIIDSDVNRIVKEMTTEGKPYKTWNNNVFSFSIPIPKFRENTPSISIEHLYTDDEIKTEYLCKEDNTKRRLFMGNEFDSRGIGINNDYFCEKKGKCGPCKISILDGSAEERISKISEKP